MKKQGKFLAMLLALAMMVSLLSVGAFAAMDNDHDRISVSTEGVLSVSWSAGNYGSGAIVSESNSYYPSTFVLFVDDASSIVVSAGSYAALYETEGGTAYQVTTTGAGTITITLNNPATAPGVYTLSYSAAQGEAAGGTNPTSVVSYLPIGQYASGAAWGTSAGKFTSGMASTEVCGVYVANPSASTVGVTAAPEIWDSAEENEYTPIRGDITDLETGNYHVYSNAANVFVNGVRVDASDGYALNVASGGIYQIVVQDGTAEPYITWIK